MTYYKLTNAEQKILKAFETGKLKSVPNLKKEIARYQSYAQAMRKETEEINIKLTKLDVQKLKEKAAHKGVSYQKLASSLLHQYGNQ